ncbi:MAG: glycosyltransferase [archaeon]
MAHKKTGKSVTIIIPTYNGEKTLAECLDALTMQTIHPNEIMVVDDGSTDGTKTVAESYSMVTVLSQTNAGPAKARNAGAKKAKTNIIIFLDSDCVPEATWIEEMLKPFSDENVVGVQGAYKTNQTALSARFDQLDIEYRYERMKKSKHLDWIGCYSAAYKRDIFIQEGGFDETFPKASGEDSEFSYRLAKKGHTLVFNPRAIVYHTHPPTIFQYLRVKFARAYWRTRMYIKHPEKSIRDSYTPHLLKINFFVGGLFLVVVAFIGFKLLTSTLSRALVAHEMEQLFFFLGIIFAIIILTLCDFLLMVAKKDLVMLPYAVVIVFLRSIVFVLGAGLGLIDPRVRA